MEPSVSNNQKFLAHAPNCMSLQMLISSSVSLAYTISTNQRTPQWSCLSTVTDARVWGGQADVCALCVVQTLTLAPRWIGTSLNLFCAGSIQ